VSIQSGDDDIGWLMQLSVVEKTDELKKDPKNEQLERKELEKAPKFNARPLNKKVPPKPELKQCTRPEPDPIPVPEKVRIPLTEVQEFDLHVEHRAVDRADFDKMIKEKELMSSRGVTKPKLPRLNVTERTERRKMVVAAATSSAASNMR
ncbi:hypothetical protein SSX86_031797, partial [Deinandra increscens subsp. villosa]